MKAIEERLAWRRVILWARLMILFAGLTVVPVSFAQEQLAEAPPKGKLADTQHRATPNEMWKDFLKPGVEVFEGNYVDWNTFLRLLQTFDIQAEFRGDYKNQWFLRFKDPADAERARQILKKIDVPPRRIVLQFQLVLASDKSPVEQKPLTDPTLLNQLRQVFKFNSYRALDRAYLTLNSEENGTTSLAGRYQVSCKPIFIDEGKGVIKLRELTLSDMGVGFSPAAMVRPPGEMPKLPDLRKLQELIEAQKEKLQERKRMEEAQKKMEEAQKRDEEMQKRAEEAQRKAFAFEGPKRVRTNSRLLTTSLNIKNGDTVIVGSSTVDEEDAALITIVTATVLN